MLSGIPPRAEDGGPPAGGCRAVAEPCLHFASRQLDLSRRVAIMGVLNLTPDSFYDGGWYRTDTQVLSRVEEMIAQGADVIDVGGESTRPGARPVALPEEIARVVPRIRNICKRFDIPVSVDTYKAQLARRALQEGAELVNDISALRFDPEMAAVASEYHAHVILMHLKGTPRCMQDNPQYADVVGEVISYLSQQIEYACSCGIAPAKIIVDPGIGFGKNLNHNLTLLRDLYRLRELGRPILIGASRKSFMGKLLGLSPAQRLSPGVAAACVAVAGGARLIRCHDVSQTRQAVDLLGEILSESRES